MLGKMFNQIDRLEKSMDASWLRQEVIAQNIANADTPGYKSQRVEFEDAFRRALEGQTGFEARRTRDKHVAFGGVPDPSQVRATVVENDHYTMRMDENNVDPDHEMSELAKNTLLYDSLTVKLNGELARLKLVIREGR